MVRGTAAGLTIGMCVFGGAAEGQVCWPAMVGTPAAPNFPAAGLLPQPSAVTVFDDGVHGARFYAAGSIAALGNVAVLTPLGWQAVGAPLPEPIYTIAGVADGLGPGGGPSLYVGGLGLNRWDTDHWTRVFTEPVYAVLMYDDRQGGGPALHAVTANSLYKRVQDTWQLKGSLAFTDPQQILQRILVFDEDGPGPLPPCMYFTSAIFTAWTPGGPSVNPPSHMVRWDGQSFTAIPDTMAGATRRFPFSSAHTAAAVFDDGTGLALYLSGLGASGAAATPIVRWNSEMQRWEPLGQTTGGPAYALAVLNDGLGPVGRRLYAFSDSLTPFNQVQPSATVMAWDGQAWTGVTNVFLMQDLNQQKHLPIAVGSLGVAQVPGLLLMTGSFPFGLVGCRCRGDVNLDGAMTLADRAIIVANLGTPHGWTGGDLDGNGIVDANDLAIVCTADFNCDGFVTQGDIVDFLNAWFEQAPRSDYNGTGGVSVPDIFDFLNDWFVGC